MCPKQEAEGVSLASKPACFYLSSKRHYVSLQLGFEFSFVLQNCKTETSYLVGSNPPIRGQLPAPQPTLQFKGPSIRINNKCCHSAVSHPGLCWLELHLSAAHGPLWIKHGELLWGAENKLGMDKQTSGCSFYRSSKLIWWYQGWRGEKASGLLTCLCSCSN